MDSRQRADLDRHITGNYGEDQFKSCTECGQSFDDHAYDGDKPVCNLLDEIVYQVPRADGWSRVAIAVRIAQIAHRDALDKSGQPLIGHPLRVAARGQTEDEMILGALHDTIEDTALDLRTLAEFFDERIILAVDAISQRKKTGETYWDYIDRVAKNDLARRVKLADIRDNMDPRRQWADGPSMTKARYLPAWKKLTGRDYDPGVDGR